MIPNRVTMLVMALAVAIAPAVAEEAAPATSDPPAGAYQLDKAHTSVVFRVSHLGFSMYTARFTRFDGVLHFDPTSPAAMTVEATIDASSLETDNLETSYDFDAILTGKDWLDAGQFPMITFRSSKVDLVSPNSAKVTGDLTMHGVTRPVELQVTYNGGYGSHPYDPGGARIGFSATGTIKRSEFGVSLGIPAPGTTMGVGDNVEVIIETEFQKSTATAP